MMLIALHHCVTCLCCVALIKSHKIAACIMRKVSMHSLLIFTILLCVLCNLIFKPGACGWFLEITLVRVSI